MSFDFSGYADAWGRHDHDGVAAHFTADGTYEDTTLAKLMEGTDAIAGFVRDAELSFSSDFTFTVAGAVGSDEGYFMEWVMAGTHDRSGTLPATGKPYAIRGVSVGTFEGGLIKANRDYWNALALMAEVGLLPAPAA